MENLINLTWNPEITVGDFIAFLSFLVAIIGSICALHKWIKNIALKRAEYVGNLTEKIRTDNIIAKAIYIVDYSINWYDKNFHTGGEIEACIDRAFTFFSYICYLREKKLITKTEFSFFKYHVHRILVNSQTQDYFYNLYHFSQKNKTPMPFEYLLKYAKKSKLLDDDFWKVDLNNSKKYHHYLNF